jgi:hypothetical protein
MRQSLKFLLLAASCAAVCWAVKPGGSLYIKVKDAKLTKTADPRDANVVARPNAGVEVIWRGASPSDKSMHEVTVEGKTGFTAQANLSPSKPKVETISDDGKKVDAQALASSGAGVKALSEAALKYSGGKVDPLTAAKGLMTAEAVSLKANSAVATKGSK